VIGWGREVEEVLEERVKMKSGLRRRRRWQCSRAEF
jgi:hypothetical protein